MTVITGYLSVACFAALAVKYILRKLALHKANAFFMKLHEAASALLLIAALAHMILAITKIALHPVILVISGIASFALAVIIIAACHMTKDKLKRMKWHRWLSLMAVITIITHIVSYF